MLRVDCLLECGMEGSMMRMGWGVHRKAGCEVQPRLITEFLIGQPGLRNCQHHQPSTRPQSTLFKPQS